MTRFILNYLRPVALFLSIIVLFQCCRVYYKDPVSLDDALKNDIKRVKVITKDDRVFVFDSIYIVHDKIYGHLLAIKGKNVIEKVGVEIKKETIKEIHLYNKRKSNGMTALLIIGIPIGIIGIAFAIWAAQGFPLDIEMNWD